MVLYNTDNGAVQLEVHLEKETVWLTQDQMAELFGRECSVITKHLRNVLSKMNSKKRQFVQNLHILPPTVKSTQMKYYSRANA